MFTDGDPAAAGGCGHGRNGPSVTSVVDRASPAAAPHMRGGRRCWRPGRRRDHAVLQHRSAPVGQRERPIGGSLATAGLPGEPVDVLRGIPLARAEAVEELGEALPLDGIPLARVDDACPGRSRTDEPSRLVVNAGFAFGLPSARKAPRSRPLVASQVRRMPTASVLIKRPGSASRSSIGAAWPRSTRPEPESSTVYARTVLPVPTTSAAHGPRGRPDVEQTFAIAEVADLDAVALGGR